MENVQSQKIPLGKRTGKSNRRRAVFGQIRSGDYRADRNRFDFVLFPGRGNLINSSRPQTNRKAVRSGSFAKSIEPDIGRFRFVEESGERISRVANIRVITLFLK